MTPVTFVLVTLVIVVLLVAAVVDAARPPRAPRDLGSVRRRWLRLWCRALTSGWRA